MIVQKAVVVEEEVMMGLETIVQQAVVQMMVQRILLQLMEEPKNLEIQTHRQGQIRITHQPISQLLVPLKFIPMSRI
jgi:hypothetical protein